MGLEILIADPAKNITVFVLTPVEGGPEGRAEIARALMAHPGLGAEQVGFVVPPVEEGGIWRLEMMGGEFCGNAARSFGLFVARSRGLSGKRTLDIGISGIRGLVPVTLDTEAGLAEVEIPRPLAWETLDFSGRSLPVCIFEGIIHVIAPDFVGAGSPDTSQYGELFSGIRRGVEERFLRPDALGVMFYDTPSRFMTPAVYVYATDSLVFESSCGSGSAALAAWETRELRDGEGRRGVHQPGGIIEVRVDKAGGEIRTISIGGKVDLRGPILV